MSKAFQNCAELDKNQRSYVNMMSSDLVNDLQDAFDFYDTENRGYIQIAHFRNIMQNFGYHNIGIRDANDELKKLDPQFHSRNCVNLQFVKEAIAFRYHKGTSKETGQAEEARECFRLFDKYEKNVITTQQIESVLHKFLEITVTTGEVKEFMEFVGEKEDGYVTYQDFIKFYNS